VLLDVPYVVPVDLGDVNEPDLAVLELEERPVRGDAVDGPLYDRPDLCLCDWSSFRR
jgi:hypothetical protein